MGEKNKSFLAINRWMCTNKTRPDSKSYFKSSEGKKTCTEKMCTQEACVGVKRKLNFESHMHHFQGATSRMFSSALTTLKVCLSLSLTEDVVETMACVTWGSIQMCLLTDSKKERKKKRNDIFQMWVCKSVLFLCAYITSPGSHTVAWQKKKKEVSWLIHFSFSFLFALK